MSSFRQERGKTQNYKKSRQDPLQAAPQTVNNVMYDTTAERKSLLDGPEGQERRPEEADSAEIVIAEKRPYSAAEVYKPKERRVCCWRTTERASAFASMSQEERKARVAYLWGRVRAAARASGGLDEMKGRDNARARANFGLDSDVEYELSEGQSLEEELHFEEEAGFSDLAWYLISPESRFSQFQNIQVQLVTMGTLALTPLLLVFSERYPYVKDALIPAEWVVDISWSIEICLNFITADANNRTFKTIAADYLRFWFWVDAFATFPAIIAL